MCVLGVTYVLIIVISLWFVVIIGMYNVNAYVWVFMCTYYRQNAVGLKIYIELFLWLFFLPTLDCLRLHGCMQWSIFARPSVRLH